MAAFSFAFGGAAMAFAFTAVAAAGAFGSIMAAAAMAGVGGVELFGCGVADQEDGAVEADGFAGQGVVEVEAH